MSSGADCFELEVRARARKRMSRARRTFIYPHYMHRYILTYIRAHGYIRGSYTRPWANGFAARHSNRAFIALHIYLRFTITRPREHTPPLCEAFGASLPSFPFELFYFDGRGWVAWHVYIHEWEITRARERERELGFQWDSIGEFKAVSSV